MVCSAWQPHYSACRRHYDYPCAQQEKNGIRYIYSASPGETRSLYPRINLELLPGVSKKIINVVLLIRNHIADKGGSTPSFMPFFTWASGGIGVWIRTQTLYHAGGSFRPTLNQLSNYICVLRTPKLELPGLGYHRTQGGQVQIEQVLVNMVRNSLEALRNADIPDVMVVIQTRLLADNMAEVTIADNGPGIDVALTGKVFEPFQSGKKTGMGIGLSLSRTIIEKHGGKLWLDKHYQNGALFGFNLPVAK